MAKAKTLFFCSACGNASTRWLGRCPACDAWNSYAEAPVQKERASRRGPAPLRANVPIAIDAIDSGEVQRIASGIVEFDALLGGGVVPGSLILVGGAPGVGKSTLLLDVAARLAQAGPAVYVCGEESAAQTKLRAERLGIRSDLAIFPETNLRAILDAMETFSPKVLVVDSIQTMYLPEGESYAGSVAQVRDCAQALMEFAKRRGCATFVVGHVTKDGAIAGPRLLEHIVDTVLYFEGESSGEYRILRAYKNRFGSADEICVFAMDEAGLHEVRNPSQLFLGQQDGRAPVSGACVLPAIVGSRPVLVEIQALVGEATYGTPRRLGANIDPNRLAMVLAVLERRAGLHLGGQDVYVSVAGGLRITEPAADLAIALAIASAFRERPILMHAAAFGEIGLAGELRRVPHADRRTSEASKLGFAQTIDPARAKTLVDALALAFP